MRTYILSIALLLLTLQAKAQQGNIAQLHQTYQTAMGMLKQLQNTTPQDSAALNREWQRLHTVYKQVSDSLQQHGRDQTGIHFEAQRLIDIINYRQNDAQLDQQLRDLYHCVKRHQYALLEDDAQFTKIAQCLMGVKPVGETNETKIITYNMGLIQDFYKEIDTSTWSKDKHQRFVTTFAKAYLKIGSVRKAEKLYRHFDTLFVKPTTSKTIKNFSLPDSISLQNPYLMLTTKNWSSLQKGKIVIRPKGENLFDLVYLISLLRTIHREYAEEYDIVIVRSSFEDHNAYLSAVKQNLAFSDYYIATLGQDALDNAEQLPAVMMVNAEGNVTYLANHTNELFKELNAPIEAKKEQKVAAYRVDIKQKKDSLTQRAAQTKDSTSYKATHENITFILKGLWDEDLTTQLIPMRWRENAMEPDSSAKISREVIERSRNKPYLAEFIVQHPQYTLYRLAVLVTGKNQEITITSGFPNAKEVSYGNPENATFYKALQTIDQSQAQLVNYDYILESYPFQNRAFISYMRNHLKQAKAREQEAINSVKNAKTVLMRYADEKREQMQMMR